MTSGRVARYVLPYAWRVGLLGKEDYHGRREGLVKVDGTFNLVSAYIHIY